MQYVVGARHPQSFGIYNYQIDAVPLPSVFTPRVLGHGARHPQSFGIYNYQIDVPYHLSSHQGYWGMGHGIHNLLVYTIIKSTPCPYHLILHSRCRNPAKKLALTDEE